MKTDTPAAVPAATSATAPATTASAPVDGKENATTERARISAILGSEEAKDRGSLAHHLAFETDMSADAAKALLAKSAKEAAATPAASTIAARTHGQGVDVALGSAPMRTQATDASSGWDAAAAAVNKQFGVSSK